MLHLHWSGVWSFERNTRFHFKTRSGPTGSSQFLYPTLRRSVPLALLRSTQRRLLGHVTGLKARRSTGGNSWLVNKPLKGAGTVSGRIQGWGSIQLTILYLFIFLKSIPNLPFPCNQFQRVAWSISQINSFLLKWASQSSGDRMTSNWSRRLFVC